MLRSHMATINGCASRVVATSRGPFHLAASARRPGWIRCGYTYVEAGPRGIGPERHVIVWAPGPIVDDETCEAALAHADPIADAYAAARWPGCVLADSAVDVDRSIYGRG